MGHEIEGKTIARQTAMTGVAGHERHIALVVVDQCSLFFFTALSSICVIVTWCHIHTHRLTHTFSPSFARPKRANHDLVWMTAAAAADDHRYILVHEEEWSVLSSRYPIQRQHEICVQRLAVRDRDHDPASSSALISQPRKSFPVLSHVSPLLVYLLYSHVRACLDRARVSLMSSCMNLFSLLMLLMFSHTPLCTRLFRESIVSKRQKEQQQPE